MNKKYFIVSTSADGHITYKRYKCIDGWSADRNACWKFSKQGATGIILSLQEYDPAYRIGGRYRLSLYEADENEGRC